MMRTLFVVLFLTGCAVSERLADALESGAEEMNCNDLDQLLRTKRQLLYWKDLSTKDINLEIAELLTLKEQLLEKKENLLDHRQDPTPLKTSFMQKSVLTQEIKQLLHQLGSSNSKLELTDIALNKINILITKTFSEKEQLTGDKVAQIEKKLQALQDKEHECSAILRPISHNKPVLASFDVDLTESNEVGFGYWARLLEFYPEKFHSDLYFLSRVSQNEHYTDNELGDRKLAVHLTKRAVMFSTYDIKTYSVIKKAKVSIKDPSNWFYVYYSFKDNIAVGFLQQNEKISRVEFHVEHFKLGEAWFKIGGADVDVPGFNGQIAQLTYGVGKGYYISEARVFVQENLKQHPKPQLQALTIPITERLTKFPQEIQRSVENEFISEYSIGGWFKMKSKGVREVFLVSDQTSKYALSLYGGDIISVATYAREGNFRKFKMYDNMMDWHYFYLSYSYGKREFNSFLWADGKVLKAQESNVIHEPTNRLVFNIGHEFDGQANHVKLYVGEGCHIQLPGDLPPEFNVGIEFLHKEVHSYHIKLDPKIKAFAMIEQNVVPKSLQVEKVLRKQI